MHLNFVGNRTHYEGKNKSGYERFDGPRRKAVGRMAGRKKTRTGKLENGRSKHFKQIPERKIIGDKDVLEERREENRISDLLQSKKSGRNKGVGQEHLSSSNGGRG